MTPETTAGNGSLSRRYLALGDSYTIGEGVKPEENFPSQLTELLKLKGYPFSGPEIIAKTGWTTDELLSAIDLVQPSSDYDLVSLLIGVNNQYRGRSLAAYVEEFEVLLKSAIRFAGGRAERVLVLSIPDWGVTPFAEGRDRSGIAREIDAFNALNKRIATQYAVNYLDITPGSRKAALDTSLLTGDGLHPSPSEYRRWAAAAAVLVRLND